MRILNIVGAFPPAFAEGGPGVMAYNLSRELIKLGHQVSVITTDKCLDKRIDVPKGPTQLNGVPVRYCHWQRSILPYHSAQLRTQVRQALPNTDIVLLSSSWTSYGVAAGIECRRAGIPYILYAHGCYDPVRLRKGRLKKLLWWFALDRKLYKHAASVIALTKAEVKQIKSMGVKSRIEQIPIGANVDQLKIKTPQAELERKFPQLTGRPIVLFLSRIESIKGVDLLVKSFAEVHVRVPDAILVIAGPHETQYARKIRDLIRDIRLSDSVILTGEVTSEDKAALLNRASVFCLTSHGEGLPAVVLEAMYCRTPVVISQGCNLPEVEHAQAGCVTNLDPSTIAHKITTLLLDGQSRSKMADNAKRLVDKQFTWPKVASKTAALCERIRSY
ncbi:MAG: glycosyltransferase [Phycisphaerae bacterium]|nr:glycosyltransferase [Phycisphaerae bacterium]